MQVFNIIKYIHGRYSLAPVLSCLLLLGFFVGWGFFVSTGRGCFGSHLQKRAQKKTCKSRGVEMRFTRQR